MTLANGPFNRAARVLSSSVPCAKEGRASSISVGTTTCMSACPTPAPQQKRERPNSVYMLSALLRSLRRVVLFALVGLCIDDHGSLVIFRSASVRPKHLFDQYFDHDYLFELPFRGSGMPNQVDGVLVHTM